MSIIEPKSNGLTLVSLFAGCGGSSLGYKQAGYDVRLAVEWEPAATAVYRLNFPDTMVWEGDIAKLTNDEALRLARVQSEQLDVLDGSPPCQGFSTAGKRAFGDAKNQLFREYVRLLMSFRPRAFVMENVSGMIKGKMKLVFAEILTTLKAVGYKVSCRLLNAWWYGVPQNRKRVILVGIRDDINAEPGHPQPSMIRPLSVMSSLGVNGISSSWRADIKNAQFHNKWRSCSLPSPTLSSSQPPLILMDNIPRLPTIAEGKILQGFPVWFQFIGTYKEQWARIGNSVPPPMSRAIGYHLAKLLHS